MISGFPASEARQNIWEWLPEPPEWPEFSIGCTECSLRVVCELGTKLRRDKNTGIWTTIIRQIRLWMSADHRYHLSWVSPRTQIALPGFKRSECRSLETYGLPETVEVSRSLLSELLRCEYSDYSAWQLGLWTIGVAHMSAAAMQSLYTVIIPKPPTWMARSNVKSSTILMTEHLLGEMAVHAELHLFR